MIKMKNFKLIPFFLLFFITVNCGFKVLDRSALNKFKINEISSSGNKKINFLIRNDLNNLLNSNKSNDLLKINLVTNKVKNIKEKNKKNQITKYNIIISSKFFFIISIMNLIIFDIILHQHHLHNQIKEHLIFHLSLILF